MRGTQREIGVRRALGAGTGGIAAYFFAESALPSAAGAVLGLIMASYAIRALVAFGPVSLPRLHDVLLAPVHLLFALSASLRGSCSESYRSHVSAGRALRCGTAPGVRRQDGAATLRVSC